MYKTVIKIDGMMCGMCESHICDHIRNNLDVKKVSRWNNICQMAKLYSYIS